MNFLKPFRSGVMVALIAAALPCFAGEVAVLKNGFSIRHERHETVGEVTRLYTSADGSSFVDVPTAQLDHFEAALDVPAAKTSVSASRLPGSIPSASTLGNAFRGATPKFPNAAEPDITAVVKDASGRYQLDPDLVNSVIQAESGFHVRAVSPKGAQGLMQLMPGTASQLGVPNAFDPRANVDGGTKYLRELLERYNFDLVKALAAYNAGPQRVERFGGVPPYYETHAYVARIIRNFNKKKMAEQKATVKKTPLKAAGSGKMVTPPKANSSKSVQAKADSPKE
jgi:soluble lytic murein transglycosylase-like protein